MYDAASLIKLQGVAARRASGTSFPEQKVVVNGGRVASLAHAADGKEGAFAASLKGIPIRVEYKITKLTINYPKVIVEVQLSVYVDGMTSPVYVGTFGMTCEDVTKPETCRVTTRMDQAASSGNPSIQGCSLACVAECAGGICSFCFDLGDPVVIATCVAACAFWCWWDCC